jgi:hypothetical protein
MNRVLEQDERLEQVRFARTRGADKQVEGVEPEVGVSMTAKILKPKARKHGGSGREKMRSF